MKDGKFRGEHLVEMHRRIFVLLWWGLCHGEWLVDGECQKDCGLGKTFLLGARGDAIFNRNAEKPASLSISVFQNFSFSAGGIIQSCALALESDPAGAGL
jgi:hypothetical protein